MSQNQVVSFFPDTDCRYGHQGLTKLAIAGRRNPSHLRQGQFIVFVNRAQTQIKVLAADNCLVHYKHPNGHKLSIEAVTLLPRYFSGADFDYKGALRETLEKHLH